MVEAALFMLLMEVPTRKRFLHLQRAGSEKRGGRRRVSERKGRWVRGRVGRVHEIRRLNQSIILQIHSIHVRPILLALMGAEKSQRRPMLPRSARARKEHVHLKTMFEQEEKDADSTEGFDSEDDYEGEGEKEALSDEDEEGDTLTPTKRGQTAATAAAIAAIAKTRAISTTRNHPGRRSRWHTPPRGSHT